MNLFTGTNAHHFLFTFRTYRRSDIGNVIGRYFRNKYLAAPSIFQRMHHHVHTALQAYVKARHRRIRYRQQAFFFLFYKKWNH